MDVEELKHRINNVIDQWADDTAVIEDKAPEAEVRVLPKDKRVVRTKTSGDRVYLLDEVKKTRQWIAKPEVLDALGFTMADVSDLEDSELFKYQMGPAVYRVENETTDSNTDTN